MRAEVIKCDICGAEKKAANHWFVAFADASDSEPGITFHPWRFGNAAADAIHLCGQSCAQKRLDEFLAGISVVPKASS